MNGGDGGRRAPEFDALAEARRLLREARSGALATLEAGSGQPFASLVNVATDVDGTPLLLLSRLAGHTANIAADGRASLLLAEAGKGDPLAHPRLTVIGSVEPDTEPRVRRRFLARHPKSALYADFEDFGFYRLTVERAHLNGGFARAAGLSAAELLLDLAGTADLVEAEEGAIAHMNEDHADAVALYAQRLLSLPAGRWRITGIDPEGLDLALSSQAARLAFRSRVSTPAELIRELKELAAAARAQ